MVMPKVTSSPISIRIAPCIFELRTFHTLSEILARAQDMKSLWDWTVLVTVSVEIREGRSVDRSVDIPFDGAPTRQATSLVF